MPNNFPHNTAKIEPEIIKKEVHNIQSSQLNKNIINIIKKLQKAQFEAYIVGGGVRDLVLGYKPKDFDIATNANPEQVRQLFRNSRIIGRRFKLVHIYYDREIIEVATFRAPPPTVERTTRTNKLFDKIKNKFKQKTNKLTKAQQQHYQVDGQLIRDNIYGELEDDIWRRDFTINALYYNPIDEIIIDYCGGYTDLLNHTIKILGDPSTRYREDPVRLLRALRFASKLDFTIEKHTLAPIKQNEFIDLLEKVPPARLFEEYNKFFLTGHAEKSFIKLKEFNIFNRLFPFTATNNLEAEFPQHLSFLHKVLQSTDERLLNDLPVNPAFLIAAFLWHPVHVVQRDLQATADSREYVWQIAAEQIFKQQNKYLSIPKRYSKIIEDIWYLQRLFNKTQIKAIRKIAEHKKFRAGFDFLNLRSEIEQVNKTMLSWWQNYEQADDTTRHVLVKKYEKQCKS